MQTNFIEKAIGALSPQWALQRSRARLVLGHTEKYAEKFKYEGARSDRRTDGWYAGSSDANVELMGSLLKLRDRSRDLVRNNPYAAKAIEELVGNTVGTGIVPQSDTGNAELDKIIDNEWLYFADQCDTPQRLDFYGMQSLIMRTIAESGESLVRFRPRLPSDKLRVPLQLQLLESDFLDQSRTMGVVNGHVMQGVQFDLIGRRMAYWLFSQHPGSLLILNPRGAIQSQPVPAEEVMHSYRVLRPGQVRGVPFLAPVMLALRDLDDYKDAERVRKKIEACLAAFVTQPEPQNPTIGNTSIDPVSGQRVESFSPGMIAYMAPGSEVKTNDPKPAGGYREYTTSELQSIAAGLSVPYENLAQDLSLTTFSSYRAGQLGFRNTVECYRWLTLVPMFCMPVRRRFIDTLILTGAIPAKAAQDKTISLYGTSWTAPKWESVDPVKDAEATLRRIRTGTENLFDAMTSAGVDPRTQLRKIAQINEELDVLGIILDCDPRNVNVKGVEQPTDSSEKAPGKSAPATSVKKAPKAAVAKTGAASIPILPDRRWDSPTRRFAA